MSEWLWKGSTPRSVAQICAEVEYPAQERVLSYGLSFTESSQRIEVVGEVIDGEEFQREMADSGHGLEPYQSVLWSPRDPRHYPEITYLAEQFERIRLYRDWNTGRHGPLRKPQPVDLPQDFLSESGDNLGLVINDLLNRPEMRTKLLDYLKRFHAPVTDIATLLLGGTVQIFLHEEGLSAAVPASRLSDGTLRYLCLLAILLHPDPPPLICIEEPELGLHPDILPTIAELLIDASQRSQLIVTTHSDQLVGCLGDIPEAVVVCERDEGGTKLSRLDPKRLAKWLEDYTLDQLWSMGEIGGNPQ